MTKGHASTLQERLDMGMPEGASYRGRMSDSTIEFWHDRNSFLENEEHFDNDPPYQVTFCCRTTHYWIKATEYMWEHWVVS